MISENGRNIGIRTFVQLSKYIPNANMEDLTDYYIEASKFENMTDDDYARIISGMEVAYQNEICDTPRKRFYYSYGFSEYFKNVKEDSLDSNDKKLHELNANDRYFAAFGFFKAREELKMGMESDGLIEVHNNEKIKH